MAATVIVIKDEKAWELIQKIMSKGQGVIIVSPEFAKQLEDEGIKEGRLNKLEIPEYDFGGDADHWVDICRDDTHYAADWIRGALGLEFSEES